MVDVPLTLLQLANDDDPAAGSELHGCAPGPLGEKAGALVRIGALIALGASSASLSRAVRFAVASGASVEEVLDTLVAVSTTVGLARVVAAVPGIGLGLGYDVDAALES